MQAEPHRIADGVQVQEGVIERPGHALLNAVTVRAANPNHPGYGNLLQFVNVFSKSDSGEGILYRVSKDNGSSWQEIGLFDRPYRLGHRRDFMRKVAGDCLYDEETGVVLRIVTEMLWENEQIHSLFRKRRMYSCLSFDNGATWTDPIYIYQTEGSYDRDRMFPGITYGVNMVTSLFKMTKIRGAGENRGKIAVGIQVQTVGEDGQLLNPTGMGFFKSGCILGSWNADRLCYDWELCSTFAEVPLEQSTRGVYEPSLQELADGRLIMMLRGSNAGQAETMPGTKWISVSHDQGRNWSPPERVCYEDGEWMHSSSSCPDLVQDRQGRIWFVGIINDRAPNGNEPRYPLCVARLNTDTMTIDRASVTVLDTMHSWHTFQKSQQARYSLDFSNHHAYVEDDGTLIVHAPYRSDLTRFDSVINRYTFKLPE